MFDQAETLNKAQSGIFSQAQLEYSPSVHMAVNQLSITMDELALKYDYFLWH